MTVIGHEDREGGSRRLIVRDLVGGWALKEDTPTQSTTSATTTNQWRWKENDGTSAAVSSASTHPFKHPSSSQLFPPDGVIGFRAQALWSYFPGIEATDELSFPKHAIISEVEDINGDWYWGVYCGRKGLFPGNYVRVV